MTPLDESCMLQAPNQERFFIQKTRKKEYPTTGESEKRYTCFNGKRIRRNEKNACLFSSEEIRKMHSYIRYLDLQFFFSLAIHFSLPHNASFAVCYSQNGEWQSFFGERFLVLSAWVCVWWTPNKQTILFSMISALDKNQFHILWSQLFSLIQTLTPIFNRTKWTLEHFAENLFLSVLYIDYRQNAGQ